MDAHEVERLRRDCSRALAWHGNRSPGEMLADVGDAIVPDRYGEGGVVEELEQEVADLLGMPAAVFMPSGTMAQQIALRIHADDLGPRTVAFHPACHLDVHEAGAYERLHGLVGRPVGSRDGLLTVAALVAVAEPLAALLIELPQRDLGGALPTWEDLTAQVEWARERGAAVHLDGARLWQCGPAYDRPLAEVAGLFDSVYVSFYKDLGGLAGCCLLGTPDLVARAREWRRRHGGTLFAMWPHAASALSAMRLRLPRMSAYRDHALAIAAALDDLEGVRVTPNPPQTSMMHLHLRTTATAFEAAVRRVAAEHDMWTWPGVFASGHPDWSVVELTVGDATLDVEPALAREVVGALVS